MSSANVDFVRSIYAAWERGDFSRLADWAHPEIEFVMVEGPSPGSWKGLAAMAQAYREFMRAWDDLRVEAEEYRELDDGRVFVLDHATGRGKTSGLDLGQMRAQGAVLIEVRDEKVIQLVLYWNRRRAYGDAAITPPAPRP